jgi:hypothetical protein
VNGRGPDRVDAAADVLLEEAAGGHLGRLDVDPGTGERRLVYVVSGRDADALLGEIAAGRGRRRGRVRRAVDWFLREAAG